MYKSFKTKLVCLVLSVLMVIGCIPAFAIGAVADEAQNVYYVQGGATGDGTSKDTPAGTMSALVAQLEKDGKNVSGVEVVVKVLSNGSNYFYYNYNNGAVIPSHKATIVFESPDAENRAMLGVSPRKVGSTTLSRDHIQHLKLGGPVVFRNIGLVFGRTNGDWLEMYCGGYSASFENVKYYGYSNETYTTIAAATGLNNAISLGSYDNSADGEGGTLTLDTATLTNNTVGLVASSAYASKGYTDQLTLENDAKVVLGAGKVETALRLGGSPAGNTVAYKKNLNIVLNGTTVTELYSRNYITAMTEGHALQIIYNGGATIAKSTTGTYAIKLTRYDIYVENIEGASLDTTAVAGTYTVTFPKDKNVAIAKDASGNEYRSSGNTLTVGDAGTYNVTFAYEEVVSENTYFVQGGATGNGKSKETPAGTMAALVAQIEKDGFNVEGQEVIVKLMNGSSRFAYNSDNGAYKVVPYKATLVFEPLDENVTANLWATNHLVDGTRTDYSFLRLGGPTVMRNLSLAWQISDADWRQHYANGHDWTLENVTFRAYSNKLFTNANDVMSLGYRGGDVNFHVGGGTGGTLTIDEATIKNHKWGYLDFAGNRSDGETYNEDMKISVGAANFPSGLRLSGGTKAVFNKNVNLVLNGTTVNGIAISGSATIASGHALQVIYNGGAAITGTDNAKNLARYDIFVENIEGASLDTTSVAGTYAVTYPENKSIVYYYATDASGNYDGMTPVYYTTEETISVGKTGRYEVGFASSVSDINVEIVNDYAEFDGWANDATAGTLSPIPAASNIVETEVSELGSIVYTADVTIAAGKKAIISAVGDASETTLVELSEGALKIGGYAVAGTFSAGKYGVKLTIAPASKALFVEVTKPDGTVIRRGNDLMLAGNTSFSTISAKSSEEGAVANIIASESDFIAESYTINEEEPVLTGFEANVFNIVTSYNADAKTTRSFAFTALKSYLAEDETLVVKYNVKGDSETFEVDATQKANPSTLYTDRYFLEADITGLTAGTTYEYKIGKKGSDAASDWSGTYSFTTEAEKVKEFSFITISDTQGEAWNGRGFMYAQAAINKALEDVKNPAFILNAGDVVEGKSSAVPSDANLETMWAQYFKALGNTAKSVPHFAAMGNHDYLGHSSDANYLFNLHFNHPDNGSLGNWGLDNYGKLLLKNKSESAYSYDYGNTHVIVFNSGSSGGTDSYYHGSQKSWIEADLKANTDAKWTIVVAHIPAYDANGVSTAWARYEFNKLFEEYGVDLVIEGHAHYNTRTYPMKGGEAVRTDGNPDLIAKGEGTVYSIVGSTTTNHDKLKDNLNENYVSVFSPASEMPVYATVDVTDYTLTYTVKQLDGFVVDKFTIEKEKGEEFYTPETLGAQIRIPTKENPRITQGLRFVGEISTDLYDELAESGILPEDADATELGFGSVILPKNYLEEGEALTKQTADAAIVPAVNLLSKDDDTVKFTVCLVNIPEANYTRDYCVVPYVTLMVDGEEVTYYGEMLTANVYQIALLACGENSQESEYTKEYLKANVIDVVEANNK